VNQHERLACARDAMANRMTADVDLAQLHHDNSARSYAGDRPVESLVRMGPSGEARRSPDARRNVHYVGRGVLLLEPR